MVAIVGRPNVGKSSLLNALSKIRISIVQDMPGVTRDRIEMPLEVHGKYVNLVDTGGYGFVDPDELTEHIKHQIELAMTRAELCMFIVDAEEGLTGADQEVANLLRRKNIKTVLVANKADNAKVDPNLADFARLGLGTPIGVSALHGRNINLIIDAIANNIDLTKAPSHVPEPELMIAIVGKRNAGKSTLVNAVAELYEGHGDRVIVSEVPGTTRDSVDVRFEKDGKTLTVIDTAGVRKKRHMVTDDIQFYSFHRAERSIRRADVVFMLIEGTEPISEPDKKLAKYIADQFKPVIIVVNKWDKVLADAREQAHEKGATFSSDLLMQEYGNYLDQELPHLNYAPVSFITAKDGKNVQMVLDLAQNLFKQATYRCGTGELNRVMKTIMEERRPTSQNGRRARIFYVTQPEVAPPTIVVFVNNPEIIVESYQRFMINRMRELLPYAEVPIKLLFRGREARRPEGVEELPDTDASAPGRAGGKKIDVRTKLPRPKKNAPKPTRRPPKAGR
jgi:GTP-binding protein